MGVSKNRDTPKWMVYNGKPYQNGWFGGTTIFGNIHILFFTPKSPSSDVGEAEELGIAIPNPNPQHIRGTAE